MTREKLVVYSPPGSGKSYLRELLRSDIRNAGISFYDADLHHPDSWDIGIVFTNNPEHMVGYYSLAVRYPRDMWDDFVKSKCPDWTPSWYDESYSVVGSWQMEASCYLSYYAPEIMDLYRYVMHLGEDSDTE